jgi:hypothetical protein
MRSLPNPEPGRARSDVYPPVITERMLMRHGWYRRKLRKQGIAIDPGAKNAMVLSRPHQP